MSRAEDNPSKGLVAGVGLAVVAGLGFLMWSSKGGAKSSEQAAQASSSGGGGGGGSSASNDEATALVRQLLRKHDKDPKDYSFKIQPKAGRLLVLVKSKQTNKATQFEVKNGKATKVG